MVEVTEMKRKVYQTKDGYRVRYAMRLKNVLDGGEARPLKSAYIMMTLIEMIEKNHLVRGQLLEYRYQVSVSADHQANAQTDRRGRQTNASAAPAGRRTDASIVCSTNILVAPCSDKQVATLLGVTVYSKSILGSFSRLFNREFRRQEAAARQRAREREKKRNA